MLAAAVALLVGAAGAFVLFGGNDGSSDSNGPSTVQPTADPSVTTVPPSAPGTADTGVDATSTTTASIETTAPSEDPSTITTAPPTLATVAPPSPTPAGPPVIASIAASVIRSDSSDACGNPTSYQPSFLNDGDRTTAWMAPGDGTGQSVLFTFRGPSLVQQVGVLPGYDKYDVCADTNRFYELRRVTSVTWTFDDGASVVQEVSPTPDLQTITFPEGVVTSSVLMTVSGTLPPGLERLDHTPISEVLIR